MRTLILISMLVPFVTGCASSEPAPQRTITRTIKERIARCPTDDELRDAAIVASKWSYYHRTGGPCACPGDEYREGKRCTQVAQGVMCQRDQVTVEVVAEMKAQFVACRT